jgi:hypothetical protein
MAWWNVIGYQAFWVGVTYYILDMLGLIFLPIGLRLVQPKYAEPKSVLFTTLGVIPAYFMPWFTGWILYLYIIKVRHNMDWSGAFLTWFVAWIVPVAIGSLIFLLFVPIPRFLPTMPI